MRGLILAPNHNEKWNWTHQLFRNAISRHCDSTYYGRGFFTNSYETNVSKIIKEHGPFDFIFVEGQKYAGEFTGLAKRKEIKITEVAEYGLLHRRPKFHEWLNKNKFDIVFAQMHYIEPQFKRQQQLGNVDPNIEIITLPFSIDPSIYNGDPFDDREYDLTIMYSLHNRYYPHRKRIAQYFENNAKRLGFNTFIHYASSGKPVRYEYIEILRKTKIFLNSNCVLSGVPPKYTEAMACGAALLTDTPGCSDKYGFKDRENLMYYPTGNINSIIYNTKYLLKNPDVRKIIAENGQNLVFEKFTNDIQVKRLLEVVAKKLN